MFSFLNIKIQISKTALIYYIILYYIETAYCDACCNFSIWRAEARGLL